MLQPYPLPNYDPDRENWIDLDGTKNFYLHLTFGSNNPITDINFYYIAQKHEHKLVSHISLALPGLSINFPFLMKLLGRASQGKYATGPSEETRWSRC